MKKLIVILAILTTLTGCATLMSATEAGAQNAAVGVQEYCRQTTPLLREQFRNSVNTKLPDGMSVKITCPFDGVR